MAQAGAVLGGRYVLEEQIGNGGYGEVWRAADTVLSRSVAIKLLHLHYAGQREAVARFRAEARQAAALSQENIARVYDYGEAAGGQPPYLVMELVAGRSLEAVLAGGPLDDARTMDIVAQAAAGLQAAHAAGMVHRDIKPGNLLLAPGDTVKITDFGIAHTVGSASITVSGELIGTPAYLAPERAMGEPAGPASDLYALGIVAYECLAGTRPFDGAPLEVALAHRDRPLPPLPASVTPGVNAFVMRLTAKDPARRLSDAAEVSARAGLLRDGTGTGTAVLRRSSRIVRRSPRIARRARDRAHRGAILAYACAALAAATVIVVASIAGLGSPAGPAAATSTSTSTPAPASSSSSAPASRDRGTAAPPSGRRATSPARPAATRAAAHQRQTPVVPVAGAGPGGNGPGPGGGPGKDKGPGNGKDKGKDKGKGGGNG